MADGIALAFQNVGNNVTGVGGGDVGYWNIGGSGSSGGRFGDPHLDQQRLRPEHRRHRAEPDAGRLGAWARPTT
jgi:hypothetical protein